MHSVSIQLHLESLAYSVPPNRPRSTKRRGCGGMLRRRTSARSSSWRLSPTGWRRCRWALWPGLLFGLAVQLLLLLQCC